MISSEGLKPLKHHADGRKFPHFYKETHFLKRGDTAQKQGVAQPGLLQVFTGKRDIESYRVLPKAENRLSYRRATLVNWMTDTENGPGQQLARVIVNRIWQQYFGTGIVGTPNDFGFQGERPTHPELLDWLARKLIEEKWSLKAIHRLILNSAVYQQSSEYDPQDAEKDLDNRLLWRFSPRRLEAESIRDSMLAVSQALDRKMFGPGSLDEKMTRRSIYFMIKRSRLIPMMQIFDSPEPLVSVGARPATTIAPQALLFMNNPNVRQYANHFARRLLAPADKEPKGESLKKLVDAGFQAALARKATQAELSRNVAFIRKQLESYEREKKANGMELALGDFCQVLFCLNEFIYID